MPNKVKGKILMFQNVPTDLQKDAGRAPAAIAGATAPARSDVGLHQVSGETGVGDGRLQV